MIPQKIIDDLKNGMGLEECLIKHNTNLKTLFKKEYRSNVNSNSETKYIEHKGSIFYIKKKKHRSTYYYGKYSSLEDAQLVRDELILRGWKQHQVNSICEELGVECVPGKNEQRFYEV